MPVHQRGDGMVVKFRQDQAISSLMRHSQDGVLVLYVPERTLGAINAPALTLLGGDIAQVQASLSELLPLDDWLHRVVGASRGERIFSGSFLGTDLCGQPLSAEITAWRIGGYRVLVRIQERDAQALPSARPHVRAGFRRFQAASG